MLFAQDVLPQYGLSMHKPSTMWPPPSEDLTRSFHANIRDRISCVLPLAASDLGGSSSTLSTRTMIIQGTRSCEADDVLSNHVEQVTNAGFADRQLVEVQTEDGETLSVQSQVHFYAPNDLIGHPLISSVSSYLGGLPPLQIVVGDGEALRDEGIYLSVNHALQTHRTTPNLCLTQRPPCRKSEQVPRSRGGKANVSQFKGYRG